MDGCVEKSDQERGIGSEYDWFRRQRRHFPAVEVASRPLDAGTGCWIYSQAVCSREV